jgi:hypothetical protein
MWVKVSFPLSRLADGSDESTPARCISTRLVSILSVEKCRSTWCQLLLGDLLPSSQLVFDLAVPYLGIAFPVEDGSDRFCSGISASGSLMQPLHAPTLGPYLSGSPSQSASSQAEEEPT